MRIPLAVSLESRDGGVSKDAKVVNGLVEKRGNELVLRKRPGTSDLGNVKSGTAQHLTVWNGIKAVIGDYLNAGTISTITSSPTQTSLSPSNAGLQFTSAYTTGGASTPRLFFKNRSQGWVVNRAGTVSTVTYASSMGAGTYTLISLVRSGTTATATLAEDVFNVGDTVTIAGAGQAAYNGSQTVTAVTAGSTTPAQNITISSLTRSGTTATAVTNVAHGLTTATAYTIAGANQSAYNGSKTITVTGTTTFTYTVTVTPNATITWNSADKASVTLSGGDLTGATSISSAVAWARATTAASSGKWYWEFLVNSLSGGTLSVGVAKSTATFPNGTLGRDSSSWGYCSDGALRYEGTVYAAVATFTAGDRIGVAVDQDSGNIQFYKNGVYQGALGAITGSLYPAYAHTWTSGTQTSNTTVNFGATSFTFSIPSGYSSYQYDTPQTPGTGSIYVTKPAVVVNPTFSYSVAGSPTTPATGTITAATNGGTVPGIPYINGRFCVMDTNGIIWSSGDDDPTSWNALHFVDANAEPGAGRALAKSFNYLIAYKEWSTEHFYFDPNADPAGSPFVPVQNGFTLVGCANGDSVADVDGNLCWIAQTKYAPGRSVYLQQGLQQQKISTPDVERILNGDLLTTVYAYGLNLDGHALYVLTLTDSDITLVYDISGGVWMQWSSYTLGSSKAVSSITRSGTTATVNFSVAHTLNDGDPVLMAGANQTEYNGVFQAHVVDSDTIEIQVDGAPTTPATGTITGKPYTESYFKFTKAANYNGATLLLHETDGHLYQFSPELKRDAGLPINFFARTTRLDGGSLATKRLAFVRVIGDSVDDLAMLRWSDDDCSTFKNYRVVRLDEQQPELRRCGNFKRRTIELRHVGNTSPTLSALELEIS